MCTVSNWMNQIIDFFFHYLCQIKRDRITRLVVLPLYPQFSISTTGSSVRVLQKIFRWQFVVSSSECLYILFTLVSCSESEPILQERSISIKGACFSHKLMVSTWRLYQVNGWLDLERAREFFWACTGTFNIWSGYIDAIKFACLVR